MASWNTAVYERIKTGSIKNVVFYGNTAKTPAPPYVVIKRETDGEALRFMFYIHGAMGQTDLIERYALEELTALFREPLDVAGVKKELHEYNPFVYQADLAISDDNTISCRRDFRMGIVL